MRKVTFETVLVMLSALLLTTSVFGQWNTNGNAVGAGGLSTINNILGSASGANIPVRFQTNGANRMKLNETVSYQVNAQPSLGRDGFLLLQ